MGERATMAMPVTSSPLLGQMSRQKVYGSYRMGSRDTRPERVVVRDGGTYSVRRSGMGKARAGPEGRGAAGGMAGTAGGSLEVC